MLDPVCAACRPMRGYVLAFTVMGTSLRLWKRPREGCLQLSSPKRRYQGRLIAAAWALKHSWDDRLRRDINVWQAQECQQKCASGIAKDGRIADDMPAVSVMCEAIYQPARTLTCAFVELCLTGGRRGCRLCCNSKPAQHHVGRSE